MHALKQLVFALNVLYVSSRTIVLQEKVPIMPCNADDDCVHIPGDSVCVNDHCRCTKDRQYHEIKPAGCYNKQERESAVLSLHNMVFLEDRVCSSDDDCRLISDSLCLNGECQCQANKVYYNRPKQGCYTMLERNILYRYLESRSSSNKEVVITEELLSRRHPPYAPCTDHINCADYSNAICVDGRCLCNTGQEYQQFQDLADCFPPIIPRVIGGRIRRETSRNGVGAHCGHSNDCPANSGCHPTKYQCTCYGGYYFDGDECVRVTNGTSCPIDGSDRNFCRRGVKRAVCDEEKRTCRCPNDFPNLGDGIDGPACLNDALSVRIPRLGSGQRFALPRTRSRSWAPDQIQRNYTGGIMTGRWR